MGDALDMFNDCLKFAQIKLDKMLGAGRDVQDSHETVNVKNNLAVLLKKMDRKAGDIDHHGNKLENNDIELASAYFNDCKVYQANEDGEDNVRRRNIEDHEQLIMFGRNKGASEVQRI